MVITDGKITSAWKFKKGCHMKDKNTSGRLYTNLVNKGRFAGSGITYDRYDEESGNPNYQQRYIGPVRFRSDDGTHKNGPVIIIQAAKNKAGEA